MTARIQKNTKVDGRKTTSPEPNGKSRDINQSPIQDHERENTKSQQRYGGEAPFSIVTTWRSRNNKPQDRHEGHHRHDTILSINNYPDTKKQDTHSGCNDPIPNLAASTPVMNGKNADPACPNPAMIPNAPPKLHFGKIFIEWFTTMGYIGPRRTPMTATATAFSMSEGTNQMVTSRAMEIIA